MKARTKLVTVSTMLFSILINFSCVGLPSIAKEPEDTCADLQRIANRAAKRNGWNQTFHGFENLPMQTDVYSYSPKTGTDRLCQLGYLTSISPMGKKICRAHIYTSTKSPHIEWSIGYFRTSMYDPTQKESEFCRWL